MNFAFISAQIVTRPSTFVGFHACSASVVFDSNMIVRFVALPVEDKLRNLLIICFVRTFGACNTANQERTGIFSRKLKILL